MKVIILAGGKATRLPQSAKNIPKSLVRVAGKPILQHQIDLLEKHGLKDIRLSLGYMADKIIDYLDGKYEYIIESEPLGTGGAIKFASKNLKEEFMVLNGDILSDIDLSKFIKFHKNVPQTNSLAVWYCQDARPYGLIDLKGKKAVKFKEKPQSPTSGYINAGFYILSPNIFKNIKKTSFSIEKDVFSKLAKNGQLAAFIYEGYWTDAGTEKRLKQAKNKMFHVKQ
jgi:NDP-sugar pyrophosphorylase family protein